MSLTPGTRIGSYEVHATLGAGGMGEVYRAHDVKLGRAVALKLLPIAFATDAARLARFQREAQVLASLNHPNIAQIYGLEETSAATGTGQATGPALVMELVEGITLADRIAQGPLELDEALGLARQVAEALDGAHERGIIHRDLKPANVMVTPDGVVKVLDFGLAAIAEGAGRQPTDVSNSPTLTMAATQAGVILGTAGYMSPEQAAGKPVDRRSDIWSFGVLLWEALTGKRLFDGETVSHTLADVLRAEIPFASLPPTTPPAIRLLLERCLDRDRRSRLRDIGEARIAIERYLAHPAGSSHSDRSPHEITGRWSVRAVVSWSAALVVLAAAAVLTVVYLGERDRPANVVRFQILPPPSTTFTNAPVLSPDGRRIAFDAPGPDGRPMLWIRSLDVLDAKPLPGTEGAMAGPLWSPDSRSVSFGMSGFPGQLKKVDISGGRPQVLADIGAFREGAWNADGVILFGVAAKGLMQVPEAGGTPVPVTLVDASRREVQHAGPAFLPDGRRFLYHRASDIPENRGIFLGSLDVPPEQQSLTRLIAADSDPVFVPTDSGGGRILFLREGTLYAQAFDGVSRVSGEAVAVAESVGSIGSYGWFSVSSTGDLAFRTGGTAGGTSELTWFDRQGTQMGTVGPRSDYALVQVSPDGKKVVTQKSERLSIGAIGSVEGARAWVADVSRGIFGRLNSGEGGEASPAVSPDGHVAFSTTLKGDLYWIPDSGVGVAEPLLLNSATVKHPNGFSPDGRFLIFDDHTANRQDLWILPIELPAGGGPRKPIPFVVTSADETFGQFSPNGKWIAYTSDEGGRREVYVQGFAPDRNPATAVGKWTISSAGGDKPRWSKDGKELFYIAPDRRLMAVPVKTGSTFEPGVAVPLFETRPQGFFPYAIGDNGRFLINTRVDVDALAASPVTVVLNWQEALRDK
jgi:eukaryotic-like serine/threonine-protein kinase